MTRHSQTKKNKFITSRLLLKKILVFFKKEKKVILERKLEIPVGVKNNQVRSSNILLCLSLKIQQKMGQRCLRDNGRDY